MSEEQLNSFLEAVKADAGLQEKLKGAADLDAAVALANEAGFDARKADFIRYQAKQMAELSDEELSGVAGGGWLADVIGFPFGAPAPNNPLWDLSKSSL